jgi:AAA domain
MVAITDVEPLAYATEPEADTEAKIANGIWTTLDESPDHSIARLIRQAELHKDAWHIEGLWQPNAIAVVHSLEGEFKSIIAYQIAEALATATPLLRMWNVPTFQRVGVLQTEMAENQVGARLKVMYPDGRIPSNLIVSNESLSTDIRKCFYGEEKMQVIRNWMLTEHIDVLVWDTINSVLAAYGNPNSEEAAANFYNHLELLPHKGALVVRHDSKPSKETELRQKNQKIRGSNLHAEIASTVIGLERPDKRSNRVILEIGKLRHDTVPEPLECWFDAGKMRLTLLPPPVALLEGGPMTREALNCELLERFKLKERSADDLIRQLENERFLLGKTRGHKRIWSLNQEAVATPDTPAPVWLPLLNFAPPDKIAE